MKAVRIGTHFEDAAVKHLTAHNLIVLHRNYRCKAGEIDIIALDDACLVFAEVRYRKYNAFGSAAESITPPKQSKIIRSAETYLNSALKPPHRSCRFDVLAISHDYESPHIEWIKDAFDA